MTMLCESVYIHLGNRYTYPPTAEGQGMPAIRDVHAVFSPKLILQIPLRIPDFGVFEDCWVVVDAVYIVEDGHL